MRPTDGSFRVRSLPRKWPVLGIVVLAATFVVLYGAQRLNGQSAAVLEVQQVVIQALNAEHDAATLPETAATLGVDAGMRAQLLATAKSKLESTYRGVILDQREETILSAIEAIGTEEGGYIWGGGVRDVVFGKTIIDGEVAVVQVQATGYLVMSQTATSERVSPHNRADYTITLERVDGSWYITREDMTFLPGEEP